MAFQWNWPDSWDIINNSLKESLQEILRTAMKENPSEMARGDIVIDDIHTGSHPPEIHFFRIEELSMTRVVFELFVRYKGDAFIKMSGLDINLDSCVKDTPFFCPFEMKLCDVDIESAIRFSCDRIPKTSFCMETLKSDGSLVWSMSQGDETANDLPTEELMSVAPLIMVGCMTRRWQEQCLVAPRRSTSAIDGPIFRSFRSLSSKGDNRMRAHCLRYRQFRACYSHVAKSSIRAGNTISGSREVGVSSHNPHPSHQDSPISSFMHPRKTEIPVRVIKSTQSSRPFIPLRSTMTAIRDIRVMYPHVSEIKKKIVKHFHQQLSEIYSNISQSRNADCHPYLRCTPASLQMSAINFYRTLHSEREENSSVNSSKEVQEHENIMISVRFDRNPLRNFVVESNFGSVEGADEKVEATIRALVDPVLEQIQNAGLKLVL